MTSGARLTQASASVLICRFSTRNLLVPKFVVTEVIEEPRFQAGFDRLSNLGPLMRAILTEKVQRLKAELIEHRAVPLGVFPDPQLDGSYMVEREGLRVRYYVTAAAPQVGLADSCNGFRDVPRNVDFASGSRAWIGLESSGWPEAKWVRKRSLTMFVSR